MTQQVASSVENLRAALTYYNMGFCPVLLHERIVNDDGTVTCSCGKPRCQSQGKHPRLTNWAECAAKATEQDIRDMWGKHPTAGVGLLYGDWSHVPADRERRWIVVVDVDAKLDEKTGQTGIETWEAWQKINGRIPCTPVQETISGGKHYLFKHPGKTVPTRSHVLASVDVRGDKNGQIVAAPSFGYAWTTHIATTELADIPEELLRILTHPTRPQNPSEHKTMPMLRSANKPPEQVAGWPTMHERAKRAQAYLKKCPPAISGRNGHQQTWLTAMHTIRGFALDEETALRLMCEYNSRCIPPWSEEEIKHKVSSVLSDASMLWGEKLEKSSAKPSPAVVAASPVRPEGWQKELILNKDGSVRPVLANLSLILEHADGWQGAITFDEFSSQIMLTKATPAHKKLPNASYPRPWGDNDDILTATWFQKTWAMAAIPALVCDAIQIVAIKHPVHPVRDYLNSLRWDSKERLPTWLHDYLGVEQTPYSSAVGTKWMISAVARVMKPGCQVDSMLILEGTQGCGKSSTIRTLATSEWFTDQISDLGQSKDAAQDLLGKWIVEIAELDAIRKVETSRIKAFFSRRTDHYRAPYSRHTKDYQRQCVFVGSVNQNNYLTDETGNRRFWPVKITHADLAALSRNRDLLWAEAVQKYRDGEVWYLNSAELVAAAVEEQEARFQEDAWEEKVVQWLDCDHTRMVYARRQGITMGDILEGALRIDVDRWDRRAQTRVGTIMTKLGWRKRRIREGATRIHIYERPDEL